jgi:enamine deaminase RidA (YjgF/YER057c/UK114 family)
MGRVEERLASLGIEIPDAPPPAGEYVGVRRSGALAFVSGQIASGVGGASPSGRVGVDVTVDAARSLCRAAMLNCLG